MPVIVSKLARLALVTLLVGGLAAPALGQKKDDKKLKDAERVEAEALVRAADAAMPAAAGASAWTVDPTKKEGGATAAEGTPALNLHHDALKAQEGKIYVPFALEFPADTVGSQNVALYIRVAPKGSVAPAETQQKDKDNRDFAFEDLHFTQSLAVEKGQARITRALAVPAGSYDVYLAMTPHVVERDKKAGPLRVVLLKQTVDVPDFWDGELNTSSVIVADKVEGLAAPLSPELQRERPYVLGQTEIVPAVDHDFKKTEELTIIFQIYNPTLESKKPDVTVEYSFFRKDGAGEKPFNKMAPQQFNAQTLPPQFDPEAGYQLAAGWSVPLQSFPEGDYRLEIKVSDNKTKKAVTREVRFSVAGS